MNYDQYKKYEQYLGKTLYNANGYEIGVVVGVKGYNHVDCFIVESKTSSGKYWQTARLNNGKPDQITIK